MISVLLTVPTGDHWIHRHVVAAVDRIMQDRRYRVFRDYPANKPYENNQHHIVQKVLTGGYDFWLSIDADNPPLRNPLDLIELDKDVIGLPTPIWHWTGTAGERPIYWNGYDYDPNTDAYREHALREGLQRVDAIGTGCFLMARRVLEIPVLQRGAFTRLLYADGRVHKGNDLSFCERARTAGVELYCHYDYPCRHFAEVDLHDVAMAIKGLCAVQEPERVPVES